MTKSLLKKHQTAVALYEKIKEAENDDTEILKALLEVGNDDFFIQNVEHRIAKDFYNVELWQLYIRRLEALDNVHVLDVYSRYCRLFLGDQKMVKKYCQSIFHFIKRCSSSFDF